jgi:nicotinamidase-related amidase
MRVLIVVDMQKDFCYPDGALFAGEHVKEIFKPLSDFIRAARNESIPVIFTQDWHRPDDREFRIWPPHCVMGTEGAEVIDELNPQNEDYFIRKRRYSAFYGTDLDLVLRELNCDVVIISGVLTNICVLHTAVDAASRGYDTVLLKDCTVALNDYDFEYAVKHMENILNTKILESKSLKF